MLRYSLAMTNTETSHMDYAPGLCTDCGRVKASDLSPATRERYQRQEVIVCTGHGEE